MSHDRPGLAAAAPQRSAHRRLVTIALPMLLAGALSFPGVARAQALKPWVPPSADSLLRWSAEAKVRFKENRGDSVGGTNFEAYELVGSMGRKLVRSLGRNHLLQVHAVGAVLDSLGLDVDVALDPKFPQFVLLVVRNPYRLTAHAVGFLYWYRGDDLRMQGAMFYGGLRPTMRAWWTGYQGQPYSLGVIDHDRDPKGHVRMTLFRLGSSAGYWDMVQYPEETDDMAGAGDAEWIDVNGDDRPELVAWVRARNDTLFDACMSCPYIIHEITYTESERGMRLHDMRILPSPYATFSLFVRLLGEGNRAAAARLLRDPAKVDEARLAGWGERRRAGAWMMEYAEEERWPTWLEFLHHGSRGNQRYVVHFELKEGRWIISDWVTPHYPGVAAPGDSARATPRPAGPGGRPGSRR